MFFADTKAEMRIKRLEISGFKSFVDRAVLTFEQDVTGVVGPNGCGKSNIVDAIRWCMGEQSAKHLRGRSMEDVIFNGCETRGPHSHAEVTITFDNTEGVGPEAYRDYAEIAVTRRLDRSGNSDYLINKTVVRLLDVTELFLGTGVGTKAYSIIEQGRIGYIVSSRPEDRRYLLEEAAGITRFKAKKKAAERKMEQTQQNLFRLADVTSEIERQLGSLKRQAQKAERYRAYRTEIRDLELHVASHKYLELFVMRQVAGAALVEDSAQLEGVRTGMAAREAELDAERVNGQTYEAAVDEAQKAAVSTDNRVRAEEAELARLEDRIVSMKQRIENAEAERAQLVEKAQELAAERAVLEQGVVELDLVAQAEDGELARESATYEERRVRAEALDGELRVSQSAVAETTGRIGRARALLEQFELRREEARRRIERVRGEAEQQSAKGVTLESESNELTGRIVGLRSGKDVTTAERATFETRLADLRTEIQVSDKEVETLRAETSTKRARLSSLEEIRSRFEGIGAGARAVMQEFGDQDRTSLLADRIECGPEWTAALAGALGERLQYVITENSDASRRVMEFLSSGERGRATAMPNSPRRVVRSLGSLPEDPRIAGWLIDLVRFEESDDALVRHVIDDVVVVETLDAAIDLFGSVSHPMVTKRGEVLHSDGAITGGNTDDVGAHMLDVKREIGSLQHVVAKLDADLTNAVTRHQDLRRNIGETQAALEAARQQAQDVELELVRAEQAVKRVDDARERVLARATELRAEADELAAHLADKTAEEETAKQDLESAETERVAAEAVVSGLAEAQRAARESANAQSALVTEVRVRAARARERVESDRNTLQRLIRSIEELEQRSSRLVNEMADTARAVEEHAAEVTQRRETLAQVVGLAAGAHEVLAAARAANEAMRVRVAEADASVRALRQQVDSLATRTTELQIQERELQIGIAHLLEQGFERHRIDVRNVLGDYHLREIPDAATKARIDDLARLIERMGEVNLTAIEEFEETNKRYEYLATQKADLETALQQLESAIRKMNRESRRMFRETFDSVNAKFKSVFPRMFGGGSAELRLTNPEDLLESGVEIVAQPPGKRLGSIELMSGGEKALTAVSLVFAIFQHKPSPFCLLDEVDAPLDEANVGRFANAIREMTGQSQFIVITHSKRTMETVDLLYGVTMETPGISKLVSVELKKKTVAETAPQAVAVA